MMVIRTTGLEYDDRLRKECETLCRLGYEPCIVAVEAANQAQSGRFPFGVQYETLSLRMRSFTRRGRSLALKGIEMYYQVLARVVRRKPAIIWVHNMEMAGLLPFLFGLRRLGIIERVVWDQHELPSLRVLSSSITRRLLRALMEACDVVVVASHARKEFLRETLSFCMRENMIVLANYPDRKFISIPRHPLPALVDTWLDGRAYFLGQGAASRSRHFSQLVEAIIEMSSALVVVGSVTEDVKSELRHRFGDTLDKHVYFTGMVPQLEMARYIDNALASIVLYSTETPNGKLCAPNRLYQAVARGVPVLVGNNPPMADFVRRYGCGVILKGDGRNVEDIVEGLRKLVSDIEAYKAGASSAAQSVVWELQVSQVQRVVSDGTTVNPESN